MDSSLSRQTNFSLSIIPDQPLHRLTESSSDAGGVVSLIQVPETRSAFPRDAKQFVDPMERVTAGYFSRAAHLTDGV